MSGFSGAAEFDMFDLFHRNMAVVSDNDLSPVKPLYQLTLETPNCVNLETRPTPHYSTTEK